MNKPRKLIALPKLRVFFAISLTLAIVSAYGESRAPKLTEGEIAVELFGLIAEQSGCARYLVAWIDRTTWHVNYQCTNTHPDIDHIESLPGSTFRIILDIPKAKATYRQRFGLNSLPGSITVLAHLFVNYRAKSGNVGPHAPLLIYRQSNYDQRSPE